MGKAEDLTKIDRSIKDTEIRINTVQASVDAIEKEMLNLSTLEKAVEENLKCLKERKIIAIAQEYKKAKEEVKRIQIKIIALRNDKEHYGKMIKDMQLFLKQARREYERLEKYNDNNVLNFKSRKKDG